MSDAFSFPVDCILRPGDWSDEDQPWFAALRGWSFVELPINAKANVLCSRPGPAHEEPLHPVPQPDLTSPETDGKIRGQTVRDRYGSMLSGDSALRENLIPLK